MSCSWTRLLLFCFVHWIIFSFHVDKALHTNRYGRHGFVLIRKYGRHDVKWYTLPWCKWIKQKKRNQETTQNQNSMGKKTISSFFVVFYILLRRDFAIVYVVCLLFLVYCLVSLICSLNGSLVDENIVLLWC